MESIFLGKLTQTCTGRRYAPENSKNPLQSCQNHHTIRMDHCRKQMPITEARWANRCCWNKDCKLSAGTRRPKI